MFVKNNTTNPTNELFGDYFHKMDKLLSQEMRVCWAHNTLKEYVSIQMIPGGLRLKRVPTFIYSDSFMKDWNDILSECSLSFMRLIIDQEALKVQQLHQEIESVKGTVINLTPDKSFRDRSDKMMASISKLEASIMRIKKVKYQHDSSDYQKNVYM